MHLQVASRDTFLNLQLEGSDKSSAAQLEYSIGATSSLGLSYMQTVYPTISLGGVIFPMLVD